MSPRFPIFASSSEARTATLQSLLITAIVITGLYVAREVLLPLALAILLSFVLTPLLLLLRKVKVPRVPAVAAGEPCPGSRFPTTRAAANSTAQAIHNSANHATRPGCAPRPATRLTEESDFEIMRSFPSRSAQQVRD